MSSVRELPGDGIIPDWEEDAVLNWLDTDLPGYAKLREAVRSVRIDDYSHPLWPSKLVERTARAFREASPYGRLLFDDGTLRLATMLELYNYVVAMERQSAGASSRAPPPAAQRHVAVGAPGMRGTRSDGAAGPRPVAAAASADSSGRTVQEPDRTASRDPPRPVGSARGPTAASSAEHAARAAADPPGICGAATAGRRASQVDGAVPPPPQTARPPLVGGRPSVGPGKGSGEGSPRAPEKAPATSRRPDPPSSS
jgi:hypothetical protein